MDKMTERKKMVVAMEYIVRQINDEEIMMGWLMCGVADGDIRYGDLTTDSEELDYYVEDETFSELMDCFMRRMVRAYKDGGLYCGDVLGGEKKD